ncbi:MAG: MarR family transcriptional regulator [Clostridia bacterium]|nr:MarR family transcriptional regulator [Clostridia bacterium]
MTVQDVARKYMRLSIYRRALLRKKAFAVGLHDGQLPLLEAITQMPGSTQQELSESLLVSAASIALSAKRLERAGLICRETDETNRRRNKLSVTEEGAAVAAKHRDQLNEADSAMLRGFSERELTQLAEYLDRMLDNITDEAGPIRVILPQVKGGNKTKC